MTTVRQVPLTVHHPKTPGASLETLRQLSGIVTLTGPVPDVSIFDETADDVVDDVPPPCARD